MDDVLLASDEYVIAESSKSRLYIPHEKTTMANYTYDVLLTNKRIVHSRTRVKMFGKGEIERIEWLLPQIKVIDGRVQVRLDTQYSWTILIMYMTDGTTVRLAFYDKKEAQLWASEITKVLGGDVATGQVGDLVETTNAASAIPYAAEAARAVVGTVDVFRSAFRRSKSELAPTLSIYCQNCGAAMKIKRGQTLYCQYCGNPVTAPE